MKLTLNLFCFLLLITSCGPKNGTLSGTKKESSTQENLGDNEESGQGEEGADYSDEELDPENDQSEEGDVDGDSDSNDTGSSPLPSEEEPTDSNDTHDVPDSTFYYHVIDSLDGFIIDPIRVSGSDKDSLNEYLEVSNVHPHFSGEHMSMWKKANPSNFKNTNDKMDPPIPSCESMGIVNLVPPKKYWPRTAAIALFVQSIARINNTDITKINLVSHYRPGCYNQNLKGASKTSDHLYAKAADLSFDGTQAERIQFRKDVMSVICDVFWRIPEFNVAVGFGQTKIHIGFGRERDRYWSYGLDIAAQEEFASCKSPLI